MAYFFKQYLVSCVLPVSLLPLSSIFTLQYMLYDNRIPFSISSFKINMKLFSFLNRQHWRDIARERGSALLWFPVAAEWVSSLGVRTSSRTLLSHMPRTWSPSANLQPQQFILEMAFHSFVNMETSTLKTSCQYWCTNPLCKLHTAHPHSSNSSHQPMLPLKAPIWHASTPKVWLPTMLNTGEKLCHHDLFEEFLNVTKKKHDI